MISRAKLAVLLVAGAGVAAAGAYVAGQGAPGEVHETAARMRTTTSAAPLSAASPATGSPQIAYLQTLPEPEDAPVRAARPAKAEVQTQAQAAAKKVAELEPAASRETTEREPLKEAKSGGDCKAGSRPMGDCNCYDEAAGKITLTLHPSNSCLEAESKRLGHQVIVKDETGKLGLAGEPSGKEASVAVLKGTYLSFEDAGTALAPRFGRSGRGGSTISYAPAGGGGSSAFPAGDGGAGGSAFNIWTLAKNGTCPAGYKNEVCRCYGSPSPVASSAPVRGGKRGSFRFLASTPAPRSAVPASSVQPFCSDPRIQAAFNASEAEFMRAVQEVFNETRQAKR